MQNLVRPVFWILTIAVILIQPACVEKEEHVPIPDSCVAFRANFDTTFDIKYIQPDLYKTSGEQSTLDTNYERLIHEEIGSVPATAAGLKKVTGWVNQKFTVVNNGGASIGKVTANDLYLKKEVYGCHSQALIISSILRTYDFPCVMMETASIQWAEDYRADTAKGLVGHVMTEVYLNDHWVLLDNNGDYINEYDPFNPFVSTTNSGLCDPAPNGLFVIGKGLDSWDYGVHSPDDTKNLMIFFANNLICYEPYFDTVEYVWE